MSKLADLIRHVGRTEPKPMGFGSAVYKPPPTMILVALADGDWAKATADAVAAGADIVVLSGKADDEAAKEAVAAADGRACGVVAPSGDGEPLAKMHEQGIDFGVVGQDTPAKALLDGDLSVILRLSPELTDVQLRTLEPLQVEAVMVEQENAPLTIRRQAELRRISALTRAPLLLQVAPDIQSDDLVCLRDAGVALAALDGRAAGAADAIRRVRSLIDALPPRRTPKREDRPAVTLPVPTAAAEAGEDDEHEHEAE